LGCRLTDQSPVFCISYFGNSIYAFTQGRG
jgi:hypothetical protein